MGDLREVLDAPRGGTVVNAGEDVTADDYVALVARIPRCARAVRKLTDDGSPAAVAGAVSSSPGLLSSASTKEGRGGPPTGGR